MVLQSSSPSCDANRSRDVGGIVLGIESTAHTFSIGWVDGLGVPGKSISAFVRPVKGGIHPREAADHHAERAGGILAQLLDEEVDINEVKAIAFSQGPGLGPSPLHRTQWMSTPGSPPPTETPPDSRGMYRLPDPAGCSTT